MTEEIRDRLLRPFAELPESTTEDVGPHIRLMVRGKAVGWAMENHHGNQRLEIHFKAPRGAQESVVARDPRVFFVPQTVGHRGWVGAWLDLPEIPWELIEECLHEAWEGSASAGARAQVRATRTHNHENP